jgi:uncharacterized protein (DUF488 family)
MEIKDQIFTIGYSGFQIDEFVRVLRENEIAAVIDVRSSPYSGYHVDYNKEPLKRVLKNNGIAYRDYSVEFGARQTRTEFFAPEGYLDFKKYVLSDSFQEGVTRIERGIEAGYTPALMCAEKDPMNCHRTIMVGRWFHDHGYTVRHIQPDGIVESHDSVERRLREEFSVKQLMNQIGFDTNDENDVKQITLSEEMLTSEAYDKQNRKIAYRGEDEEAS